MYQANPNDYALMLNSVPKMRIPHVLLNHCNDAKIVNSSLCKTLGTKGDLPMRNIQ